MLRFRPTLATWLQSPLSFLYTKVCAQDINGKIINLESTTLNRFPDIGFLRALTLLPCIAPLKGGTYIQEFPEPI